MNANIHVIGDKKFSVEIKGSMDCPVLSIKVGDTEVNLFFHGESFENSAHEIDTAIRYFLMEHNS